MQLVRTYCDQGKSGLLIGDRPGLQQLLRDIEFRAGNFSAVLLSDFTRWSRFPDAHAVAAAEIARRNADIEIHYCARRFVEARSPISSIIKCIKRAMARGYRRELTRPKRRRDGGVTRKLSVFADPNASTRRATMTGVPGDATPVVRKESEPGRAHRRSRPATGSISGTPASCAPTPDARDPVPDVADRRLSGTAIDNARAPDARTAGTHSSHNHRMRTQ